MLNKFQIWSLCFLSSLVGLRFYHHPLLLYTGEHTMISEETLMLSSFVGNKLEYYRKILFLVMLKNSFFYLNCGILCN